MKSSSFGPIMSAILSEFQTLVEVVAKLRGPNGCPWDKEQTQSSLTRYAIEEAFELAEAIDSQDQKSIRDELGDFLFQVILQAQVAQDEGHFNLEQVMKNLSEKMIRRHPHVFSDVKVADSNEVVRNWDEIKKAEKKNKPGGGDPENMPALLRSLKIGVRSEKWKFDWDTQEQVSDKVREELGEVCDAIASGKQDDIEEELGDLLFAVSQWARHLKIDPEMALRKANRKYEIRFHKMVTDAGMTIDQFRDLPLSKKEEMWQKTKRLLKQSGAGK